MSEILANDFGWRIAMSAVNIPRNNRLPFGYAVESYGFTSKSNADPVTDQQVVPVAEDERRQVGAGRLGAHRSARSRKLAQGYPANVPAPGLSMMKLDEVSAVDFNVVAALPSTLLFVRKPKLPCRALAPATAAMRAMTLA